MVKKLLVVVVIGAATGFALWRLGFIDEERVKDEVGHLKESTERRARDAADKVDERVRATVPTR